VSSLAKRKLNLFRPNAHPPVPSSLVVSGITKDETDTPTDGFTVYLFRMQNNIPILVDTIVSANGGLYSFSVGSDVQYWVVDYKSGAPNKAGATEQTLTGV
jgi:predicted cobalt transporter CbtA